MTSSKGLKQTNGRGERIRTSDPLVPNQVLYQAEPLPEQVGLGTGLKELAARVPGCSRSSQAILDYIRKTPPPRGGRDHGNRSPTRFFADACVGRWHGDRAGAARVRHLGAAVVVVCICFSFLGWE